MKLEVRTTRELTISQEEFSKVCKYVLENSVSVSNSFLGIHSNPSAEAFARALEFYLFTGEGDNK